LTSLQNFEISPEQGFSPSAEALLAQIRHKKTMPAIKTGK